MPLTVSEMLDKTASDSPHRPAMKMKRHGEWKTISWREYREQVRIVARGLIALGALPNKGISIIGFNSPEWILADVGAILAGAMPAGIYTTNSPEQCQFVAHHSESPIVFTENAIQTAKFVKMRAELPHVKKIIQWSGTIDSSADSNWVISWNDLLEAAKKVSEADLEKRITAQKPLDPCTLIYTSGTTGDPKAVMISHDNLGYVADVSREVVGARNDDIIMSYLPLSHVAEQVVAIHVPLATGLMTAFAESMEALPENLKEVRPSVFFGVPRVWEKIQAKLQQGLNAATGFRKRLIKFARATGTLASLAAQNENASHSHPRVGYAIADRLVFSKIKQRLGLDRCRYFLTSAAPISKDTLDFFSSLGIPLVEAYGMSECTGPATLSTVDRYRSGTVGHPIPRSEIKIASDGELLLRGRHVFLGYFKNPAATAETIDPDGWLHTGDIGEFDADGFLKITDRKKELLITAGGENVAPQIIEGKLKAIAAVSQAVVLGDRMKYLTALFALDPALLSDFLREVGSAATNSTEASECPHVHARLTQELETVNRSLARVQTIKRFKILPTELSIEGGELTPTLKLKRKAILAKYKPIIDEMYVD